MANRRAESRSKADYRATAVDDSIEARVGQLIARQPDGCWIYQGPLSVHGYGVIRGVRKHQVLAHRWVYESLGRKIPDDYHLHHTCGVRSCVNPDHLEPLTPSEHSSLHASHR